MSLVYSNSTTLAGILQLIERELGFDYGYITGSTTRLKEWTADVNLTHDGVLTKAIRAGGTWQVDDTNHSDYPIIMTDLVTGQRDYSFTVDGSSNLLLDIYKVMIANSAGIYHEIYPVDQQAPRSDTASFYDNAGLTGTPSTYDKTANGIIFNVPPNYSRANGLKVFVNREGSYFTTSDTTKKPGVDGRIHELYVVEPAWKYASRKGMDIQTQLLNRKLLLERTLDEVYGRRERDVPKRMTPAYHDMR